MTRANHLLLERRDGKLRPNTLETGFFFSFFSCHFSYYFSIKYVRGTNFARWQLIMNRRCPIYLIAFSRFDLA